MITRKQVESVEGDSVTVSKKDLLSLLDKLDKKKKLNTSCVAPHLLPIVEEWLAYKRERQETYKQKGFDVFYKNFMYLCEGNAEKAKAIVEQSMMNNWAGIFPLKTGTKVSRYPLTFDDVKDEDICPTFEYFSYWADKACPKLEVLDDWPTTAEEFNKMVSLTIGGTRGLAFVFLVLNRDGYEKYVKNNSLKWAYFNFIKANDLYTGQN